MADAEINKPEPQPSPTPSKSWADEPDDEEAEASTGLKSLSIADESKIEFFEDPDDSKIKAVATGDTPYTSAKTFEELNLSPELLEGLYYEMGFKKPSKIQAVSLPMILTPPYKDLIAQAHNGSGKTTVHKNTISGQISCKIAYRNMIQCQSRLNKPQGGADNDTRLNR